ncbi:MAG: YHS domain-containing protein, partial [Nitrospirota bacterium]
MVKDPVCGMEIEEKDSAGESEHEGKTYSFCATSCKENFDKFPLRFLKDRGGEACPLPEPAIKQESEISPESKRI